MIAGRVLPSPLADPLHQAACRRRGAGQSRSRRRPIRRWREGEVDPGQRTGTQYATGTRPGVRGLQGDRNLGHDAGRKPKHGRARIVLPEAYILIKAFALDERQKEKDAYDIHFVLRNYPPDVEALAARVRPLLSKGLAREGYGILKAKFATLESVGPSWAAKIAAEHGENYEQWQRSAFEFAQCPVWRHRTERLNGLRAFANGQAGRR